MKIITIGDIHGRSFWKFILQSQKWDEAVIMSDFFDSFNNFSKAEEIYNFKELIHYKRTCGKKLIVLIGNHDMAYMPKTVDPFMGGWDAKAYPDVAKELLESSKDMQMAYMKDNLLFTHAGVSETFLKSLGYIGSDYTDISSFINMKWRISPEEFMMKRGGQGEGDEIYQSCTWIRPKSLMRDSKNIKKSGIVQIVGHTNQNQIDIKGKATGGKYYFIDTLGTSGEYLIIEDGQFKVGKV